MAHDGGGSPHDLVAQTWTMYSLAILLYLIRVYARYTRQGLKWHAEDYLMFLAICWYTTFAVTNIAIIEGGGSSLYLPDQFETFTPQDIQNRIRGSKIEFASEMCMLNTMYTLKACMLFIYFHITSHLTQNTFVKICAGYTLFGWLVTLLTLFLNCRPLSGYWKIPPPQEECATYFRFEVIQCVFNVSSDLAILLIILPMIIRVKMAWRTKIPLIFIFSMGLVVVICACISKYFTFRDIFVDSYQFWYLREASTGMYVTNLPYVWGLARQSFRFLRSSEANTSDNYGNTTYGGTSRGSALRPKTGGGDPKLGPYGNLDTEIDSRLPRSESQEHIIKMKVLREDVGSGDMDYAKNPNGCETTSWAQSDASAGSKLAAKQLGLGITKTTEVIVEEGSSRLIS
ncbi:hypothetical protein F5884DRAFT_897308 [Xylogone sp. PMI_703]|nr:hypothetical protein F5884DRAFT_897308 [Xylogone sp. PMI_703]